jgi:hypothetical protein
MENPALRPAAIAALEPVASKHLTGGKKNQMAAFFAILHAETQTLDLLEDEVLDYYGTMPFYDFLRGNPRYEAILRAQKQRFEDQQNASKARKP